MLATAGREALRRYDDNLNFPGTRLILKITKTDSFITENF